MKRFLFACLAVALPLAIIGAILIKPSLPSIGWDSSRTRYTLPNQWRVSPVGSKTDLPGDMPGNIVFVDGTRALINTCGYHDHSLNLVNISTGKILHTVPLAQDWVGLAFDGKTAYLSGGGSNGTDKPDIRRFELRGDVLAELAPLNLPGLASSDRYVSAVLPTSESLYVLNGQSDEVFKFDRKDQLQSRKKIGYRPFAMALSPDKSQIAVSEWGDRSVVFLDPDSLNVTSRVSVGSHPTALAWHPDGRLFVTESGSNTVAVVRGKQVSRVTVSLDKTYSVGPTPRALSLSGDGNTLYVAMAGDNAVAVVDIRTRRPKVLGFIPTSRYPSIVAVSPDDKNLIVATAKGLYGPNAGAGVTLDGPQIRGKDEIPFRYILQQLSGQIFVLPRPAKDQLGKYTAMARENIPSAGRKSALTAAERETALKTLRKIKHVIYVIKENRTYDQVFGDLKQGNGDSSLVLFGRETTPNQHALAEEYVLFDNLYADGECSQVGHQWTTAAYANDFAEMATMIGYSRRQQLKADTRLTSSPGDYLWTAARKKGLWTRVYGEYVDVQEDHDSLNDEKMKADPEKYGYCERWERLFAKGARDTEKLTVFLEELKEWERTGKMPALSVMALPDDHTHGFSPGTHSPRAMVADNDRAVGQLVEALSRSRFWESTAIFVIQDDAQAGPDHVDSHRTIGQFISPYTRVGKVDSSHYSTTSMLRTIELILGLKPMSSYDAEAAPMIESLRNTPSVSPYRCQPAPAFIDEINPRGTALAARSQRLDFSAYDRVSPGELNRLLWEGYRSGEAYPSELPGVE